MIYLSSKAKKLSILFLFFIAGFCQACAQSEAKNLSVNGITVPDTTGMIQLRVDPNSALTDLNTSEFLDLCTFLPLETTKNSAFGSISQLEVTTKRYIIWDETTNAILFFDKKGKFVTKITNTDKSVSNPYKKITHFSVNEAKNELLFNDTRSANMYYYDLDGKFIKSTKKSKMISVDYTTLGNLSIYDLAFDKYRINSLGISPANLIIAEDEKIRSLSFPFDTLVVQSEDLFGMNQAFYHSHDGSVNFSTTYDYNIYAIYSDGSLKNTFRFIMPAVNTVPDDFLTNSKYKNKRHEYTNSNSEVIYTITDFYKKNNIITFRLFGHNTDRCYAYNIKTENLISLNIYTSDQSTFMLPYFQNRVFAVDKDQRFISSVDAASLFDIKLKLIGSKGWNESLPEALKSYFKSDNQQNPILTLFSVKESI